MPNFFIDRPIFAWVIAIIIMLAGGLAILKLLRWRNILRLHRKPGNDLRLLPWR